jgi:hypothetical protein
MDESPDMIKITVSNEEGDETMSIPVVYKMIKKDKDGKITLKSSKTWYQTMSLATVVGYDDHMYKLRLPLAKGRIKERIKIVKDRNTKEAMVPGEFKQVKKGEGHYRYINITGTSRFEYRKTTTSNSGSFDYKPPKKMLVQKKYRTRVY